MYMSTYVQENGIRSDAMKGRMIPAPDLLQISDVVKMFRKYRKLFPPVCIQEQFGGEHYLEVRGHTRTAGIHNGVKVLQVRIHAAFHF